SGGLLLLYGIGTVIGPTIGGPVMSIISPHALFLVTALAHLLITGYAIVRSRIRAAIPASDRDAYTTIPTATSPTLTPQSMSLADRGSNKSPETGDPAVKFG
ncbi:MAG: MFS transporter, partial [Rhizobium sp.]